MKRQYQYFLLAVGFFTRFPVPPVPDFHERDLNHAARYFPLVGLLIGLLAAVVWFLSARVLSPALAILCSMAATVWLTGAFHEDGLADSADGLGGGTDTARKLAIMQDSRLGSYGAIALVGILLFKFHALSALSSTLLPLALIAGHALSRLAAVYIMQTARYVRGEGKSKPLATVLSRADLGWASLFGSLPLLTFCSLLGLNHSLATATGCMLASLVPVGLIWIWWRRLILRNLQGYTGDTLGAAQQLTEVAFYLGLVAWEHLL